MSTANEGEALHDINPCGDFRYALLCGALISYRIAGQYIAPRRRRDEICTILPVATRKKNERGHDERSGQNENFGCG
jgi:hypothetical protein